MLEQGNEEPIELHRDLIEYNSGEYDHWFVEPAIKATWPQHEATWDTLLCMGDNSAHPLPLLFTAPSGGGKTTELHLLSQRLCSEGHDVLALDARRFATEGLDKNLNEAERKCCEQRISTAARTGTPLYLLIDAVDELYLGGRNLQDLQQAMSEAGLLDAATRLLVSSRSDTWGRREKQWLNALSSELIQMQASREDKHASTEEQASSLSQALSNKTDTEIFSDALDAPSTPPTTFRTVRLGYLSYPQVRILAPKFGLHGGEADRFAEDLEENEIARLFALRPRDVETLVGYWKRHGNVDGWTKILDWQVRNAYQEKSEARGRHRYLSLERYREGIRRIAAVCCLSPHRHVLRPDSPSVPGAPHAEDLFEEWSPQEVDELFASPLLIGKGAVGSIDAPSAVQIVQGQVVDYLAATWLARISYCGVNDAVERSLFVQPPGHQQVGIPGSRHSLAAWLGGMSPEVKRRLLELSPELLWCHGDAEWLSTDEVRAILEGMLHRPAAGGYQGATPATLTKLARPELEPLVTATLGKKDLFDHLADELFRFAVAARFTTCCHAALAWAINDEADDYTRKQAIKVLSTLGTERGLLQLVPLLETERPAVRVGLFLALVPSILNGEQLVEFLAREDEGSLVYYIGREPLPLNAEQLCLLASKLTERIRALAPPSQSDPTASPAQQGTVQLALEVLARRAKDSRRLETEFAALTIVLETHGSHFYIDQDAKAEISAALREHHWKTIWEERLTHQPYYNQKLFLCPVHADYLDWLVHKLAMLTGEVSLYFRDWAENFLQKQAPVTTAQLSATVSSETHEFIQKWDQRVQSAQEGQAKREAERAQQEDAERNENSEALFSHLDAIKSGDHQGALDWAYRYLHCDRSGPIVRTKLNEKAAQEIADAIVEGYKNWWRRSNPNPSNTSTTHGEAWALIGLRLEIQESGTSRISTPEDIRTATLLALRELNSIPAWLVDLHRQSPSVVEDTLLRMFETAWSSKVVRSSFISHLYRVESKELVDAAADIALALLQHSTPRSHGALEDAIDLILRRTVKPDWINEKARTEATTAAQPSFRQQWFRLWVHCVPQQALAWVSKERTTNSDCDRMIWKVCEKVRWDLDRGQPAQWSTFWTVESLESWIPLLIEISPAPPQPEDDSGSSIARVLTPADDARQVLDACKSHLAQNPSFEAARSLHTLARHPDARVRGWADKALSTQHDRATEEAKESWTVAKILEAERYARRLPLNPSELQDVLLGEISRVDLRMRDGDFSYPDLLPNNLSEKLVQLWVAAQLELAGQDVFSVFRENEVKDDKKVDISVDRVGVGRIPVEIKPIRISKPSYSLSQLEKTIEDQLLGQYMRPRHIRHGVLLLVRLDKKNWTLRKRQFSWDQGVKHLRDFAKRFELSHGVEIKVATIDIESARKDSVDDFSTGVDETNTVRSATS